MMTNHRFLYFEVPARSGILIAKAPILVFQGEDEGRKVVIFMAAISEQRVVRMPIGILKVSDRRTLMRQANSIMSDT